MKLTNYAYIQYASGNVLRPVYKMDGFERKSNVLYLCYYEIPVNKDYILGTQLPDVYSLEQDRYPADGQQDGLYYVYQGATAY